MRRPLIAAILLGLYGAPSGAQAQTPAEVSLAAHPPLVEATTQLPRGVSPTHYAIEVTPHADKLAFDGKARIDLEVTAPTSNIVLQALDLSFSNSTLSTPDGKALAPKVSVDADAQTATFAFDAPLEPGRYTLSTDYKGRIGTQANGLFALDYDTPSGMKRALYTQFENSDARRFIPSWDEPNYKATFTLQATVPAGQMVVSNMPAASSEDLGNGLKRVSFPQSPKMSTYLLFFAVGDFDRATAREGATELGTVVQKGKADQAAFALQSQREILREYNDYFGVPYPLPKLDNIAAPGRSQFFSAMENWGAIFTFEHSLLLDPSISTVADEEDVFSVDAHEMAHQWFGDLVTMSWWDDLWLNEGFATWMAARTTQKLHPEWKAELDAVGRREGAMGRDAVATTHPVVQKIETVEQASQAFDAITYSKGGSVIHMLENYVGENAWREGVRAYIRKHAYGNTVSDDLWAAVQAASGKPILDIAHDFTLQPGVPLIEVASATCRGGNTTLQLQQGEFSKDQPGKTPLRWRVPVVAQSVGGARADTVVAGGKGTLVVPGCGAVVVNAGQGGYYRTLYGDAQFAALREGFGKLATIDQLGIMADASALGMAGLRPASDVLDLAKQVPVDADPALWDDIAGRIAGLDEYFKGDDAARKRLRAFGIATLRPVFATLGWTAKADEPPPVALLRGDLIETLAGLDDEEVVAEARRRFAAGPGDATAMPPALRSILTGIVAEHADAATWEKLHAMAQAETTPLIKDQLYSMLASARDEDLAQRALDLAITPEPGATNSAGMIRRVAGEHPDLAFDFAVAHRAQVDPLVDTTSRSRYYPGLGAGSADPAMVGKLSDYADKYVAAGSRRATDTAIAGIRYRIEVKQERLPAIDAWLRKHGG